MSKSEKDRDSANSAQASKSASPSNYWGRGNFGSRKATTSPASSAGVQTLLIQSAASTVVTEGGNVAQAVQTGLTAQGYTPERAARIDELATSAQAVTINEGVKKASLLIPHADDV